MTRQTSIDVYNAIKNNGLLSKRRWEIYDALYEHGPATANELFKKARGFSSSTQANFHARLGELRDLGVVCELRNRECKTNGNFVIEWEVTNKLPVKYEKAKKEKCKTCDGKGYIVTQQAKFNI